MTTDEEIAIAYKTHDSVVTGVVDEGELRPYSWPPLDQSLVGGRLKNSTVTGSDSFVLACAAIGVFVS